MRLVNNAELTVHMRETRAIFHRFKVYWKNFLYTGQENFFFSLSFFFFDKGGLFYPSLSLSGLITVETEDFVDSLSSSSKSLCLMLVFDI